MIETILGILCGLLAGFMFTYGAVLQKKGLGDVQELKFSDINSILALFKNKTWFAGIIIGSLGGIPYVLSQLWVGLGNTQLLIASGLILLAIMASRMLNEPLGKIEYIGFTFIILGTIALGLANLQPVPAKITDPGFFLNVAVFYIPFFIAAAVGLIIYKITEWEAAKILGAISGIIFGCGAGFSQIGMMGFAEGNWAGLLIGFFILIIGTVIGTVVATLALHKGKAVVVIPLQSAGNYLIPVFAGLIVFQQFFLPAINGWIFFLPALIFIMLGVIFLSRIQAEMEKPVEKPSATSSLSDSE